MAGARHDCKPPQRLQSPPTARIPEPECSGAGRRQAA